jgi:hypothetical protein
MPVELCVKERRIRLPTFVRWFRLVREVGASEEFGNLHSQLFCQRPHGRKARAEYGIVFEAPDRVCCNANALRKTFLRDTHLESQPPKSGALW